MFMQTPSQQHTCSNPQSSSPSQLLLLLIGTQEDTSDTHIPSQHFSRVEQSEDVLHHFSARVLGSKSIRFLHDKKYLNLVMEHHIKSF